MTLGSCTRDGGIHSCLKIILGFRRQIGQVTVLGVVPHLFYWIEIRRIRRQPFNADHSSMSLHIGLQHLGPMHTPSIQNQNYRATDGSAHRLQERDHILSTDVLPLHSPIQPYPTPMRGQGDGTDDRESMMRTPLPQNRRLSSRRPCPSHHRLEHKSALIQKHDASTLLSGVFLYAATASFSTDESVPHPVPWPDAPASDNSTHRHGGSSRHGPDDTEHQSESQSPGQCGATSRAHWYTHEPSALARAVPAAPASARRTNEKDALDVAWPSAPFSLQCEPPPSSALLKTGMMPHTWRPLEYPALVPRGLRLGASELLTPLHFLWVSCIIIYLSSFRNARGNNMIFQICRQLREAALV